MNKITLTQTVTYEVNFYVDDFDSESEFKEFVDRIKSDDEFMVECFIENVDRDNLKFASDIKIKYDYDNLAVCCYQCNQEKGNMSYTDWIYHYMPQYLKKKKLCIIHIQLTNGKPTLQLSFSCKKYISKNVGFFAI